MHPSSFTRTLSGTEHNARMQHGHMSSGLSPDSLFEVTPILCLCPVIGEEVNKLSLPLDIPLTMFFCC